MSPFSRLEFLYVSSLENVFTPADTCTLLGIGFTLSGVVVYVQAEIQKDMGSIVIFVAMLECRT